MDDLARVKDWFDSGALWRPSNATASFVDLIRGVFRLCGAPDVEGGPGVEAICDQLGQARQYLFVLVDSLGAELLETLPRGSFLRSNWVTTLQSVFPSTTASAMASFATGQWPCTHCITGWWTRLPAHGISAVALPFCDRESKRPLGELGVTVTDLFPVPSAWPRIEYEPHSVLPAEIAGSISAEYVSGGAACTGYSAISEGIGLTVSLLERTREPALIYLYIGDLDTALHQKGSRHPSVRDLLDYLDRQLERLATSKPAGARMLVTADHGQVDVPREAVTILPPDDALAAHLECRPTGESTVPIFHVREGHAQIFAETFRARLGSAFALLSVREVEQLQLYGPDPLAPAMRQRLGTWVGIAAKPAKFYIQPCESSARHRGSHGGLRKAEMTVPLIVV